LVPPNVSSISIYKPLDIALFEPHTTSASINNPDENDDTSLFLETLNGNNQLPIWDYNSDGTPASETKELSMAIDSGTTWKNSAIYQDYIYPEIFFNSSDVAWYNEPLETPIRRKIINFSGWETVLKQGRPDAHIHVARHNFYQDGVKATVETTHEQGSDSLTQLFNFNDPVNLAPNPSSFLSRFHEYIRE